MSLKSKLQQVRDLADELADGLTLELKLELFEELASDFQLAAEAALKDLEQEYEIED
jgi:hypothetical protein